MTTMSQETKDGPSKEDTIDTYIANALNQLTMTERDHVYHDLHGVSDVIEETPQFVAEHVEALGKELYLLKEKHKKAAAYLLAESISLNYVNDRALRLKFLRAESFGVGKAAERMIRFFDLKLYLFGKDKLCKDITMEDLDSDDIATLKSGFMQLLPVRDRAGRAIFALLPSYQTYAVAENMTRVMFYILMSAMEDEESERKGLAVLIYNVGEFIPGKTDPKTLYQGCLIQAAVPLRTCSLHHCFNDSAFRFIINITMHFFTEEARARAKVHHGAHVECLYALMTFGFPVDNLPVTMDGKLKRKNHLEWIKMRKMQESVISLEERIVVPAHADVLFGRGKPFQAHIGNMRLYNLLDAHLERYASAKITEKTNVIAEMVRGIQSTNGRFLRQERCVWVVVDDKLAREKVSHAFRTRRRITSTETKSAEPPKIRLIPPDMHTSRATPDIMDTVETKRARVLF